MTSSIEIYQRKLYSLRTLNLMTHRRQSIYRKAFSIIDICPKMIHSYWKREKFGKDSTTYFTRYNLMFLQLSTVWNWHSIVTILFNTVWHVHYTVNECTNCMLKAFSCKRAKGWRQTLGFIQNVKNDMNERNRIEQLFYCTRCNDLAQVWSKYTWVHNEPFIISSFFRNLVFWSIGFLLKSCLELKFKNWNGGRDFDAVFVWKLDMASKGISHAIFVVQTMLQYYDTSIYSELNAVPKEVFYWYDIRWRNGFSSG